MAEHTISNADENIRIAATISFSSIQAIKDEPVTLILQQLCDLSGRVVSKIESKMNAIVAAKPSAR